ncbi:MAG: abortive phage infection protein [Eubacteriales bacterium]
MKKDLLDLIIKENNGTITTAEAIRTGVSKPFFLNFVKERNLLRVGHGIYLSEDFWEDPYYILSIRYKNMVFSHETALYFLGLSDREPTRLAVTVKDKYSNANLTGQGVKLYRIKKELFEIGKISVQSPMGNPIPIYDAERSLCDIMRSRSQVETQDLHTAMKEYVRGPDKNIPKLMSYAQKFKVEKHLQNYLEVLLS